MATQILSPEIWGDTDSVAPGFGRRRPAEHGSVRNAIWNRIGSGYGDGTTISGRALSVEPWVGSGRAIASMQLNAIGVAWWVEPSSPRVSIRPVRESASSPSDAFRRNVDRSGWAKVVFGAALSRPAVIGTSLSRLGRGPLLNSHPRRPQFSDLYQILSRAHLGARIGDLLLVELHAALHNQPARLGA